MAATAQHELSVAELKVEIERLSRELDQASSEKIQSAQLGLVLLEEKSSLQQRCDELESLYENARHELKFTQEALMKLDSTQKVTTRSGIEQENALINESAAMESSLTLQILELESETKQLRHELDRVISERDRLLTESSELGQDKATRESERAALRSELREARQREQRLLLDIENLEDENISLQKQVSALRSSQVEFEGLKHEVRQLREEAENARSNAEETAALRRIAERQLAEALEALQAEREAKFAAKKELDAHLSREAAYNITNLAYSIRGMPEDGTEDEGEPGGSSSAELVSAMGDHHADLFSEVHLHEISRLEKQLEQAHNENSQLSSSMRTAQVTAENESAAAALLRGGLARAASRLAALTSLHGESEPAAASEESEGGVPARAARWLTWWRVSGARAAGRARGPRGRGGGARRGAARGGGAAALDGGGRGARAGRRRAGAAAGGGRAGGALPPRVRRQRDHGGAAAAGARGRGRRRARAGAGGRRAGGAARRGRRAAPRRHAARPAHAPARRAARRARHQEPTPPRDGVGGARRGDGRAAGAGDQAEVVAVDEAGTDRDAAHRAQVQQEHGRGRARQPQVQVRDREDHRHGNHAQAQERAAAAQGGRRYLLQSARDVRGSVRGVRDAGGRADAGARRRRGGEEDPQPAAAPRRAAEAGAHAAPRGARGGPRDAHAARAQGGGRRARSRAGLLATGVGAESRRRRAAQHAARARVSCSARAVRRLDYCEMCASRTIAGAERARVRARRRHEFIAVGVGDDGDDRP